MFLLSTVTPRLGKILTAIRLPMYTNYILPYITTSKTQCYAYFLGVIYANKYKKYNLCFINCQYFMILSPKGEK